MPDAWSDRRERQYQHIKESLLDRGKPEERAEEIAARTTNRARREAGETPQQRTQGTGNPNTRLEERTRDELYNRARQLNVSGRSNLDKQGLIDAIRRAQ